MSNVMFTELPTVTSATINDIICAVQGGVSVQEKLSQIVSLVSTNIVLSFAGNPNGNIAGTTYQLLWDTIDEQLFICTVTGSTSTTVWTQVTNSTPAFTWDVITSTSANMMGNTGYITNNASTVTLLLPASSTVGEIIRVAGQGAGGWSIAQGTGQSIVVGSLTSTVGPSGSVSSTLPSDAIELVNTVAATQWTLISGPSGNLTIV